MQSVERIIRTLRHCVPCIFTAAIGIAVSIAAASISARREEENARLQFRVLAENHFMVLQSGLNEYVNRLRALRARFDSASHSVTADEFAAFTCPLLLERSAIATLSWLPRVRGSERARFERMAASRGLPDYHVKSMGEHGRMSLSPPRDEYYPILFATVPKTSTLYGLDLRSEPETLIGLEHARDTDRLGFSQIASLVTTGGTEGGFLFSLPVYRRGAPHESVADRRQNLVGFVHGSLITRKMVDDILIANKTPKGLDSFFFAPDSDALAGPVYVHGSRLRTTPVQPVNRAALATSLHWSRDLMADGQRWLTMEIIPMPNGPLSVDHGRAWLIFIFGLIITGAAIVYVRSSQHHAYRMMLVNRKVSDLAQIDPLTLLANRRAFVERLGATFAACGRGAKPFAVLYFDLDYFKDVNDTLGHAVGDALLQQVAERVRGLIRKNDVAARFGGDEFAILQFDVEDLAAAGTLGEKIGRLVAQPYRIGGSEIHVSVSIGIARYAPEVDGPETMMIQADLALYRAKEDGRNCFRFHSAELDRQVQERVILAEELRGAIERNELELEYQPEVELGSGRIIGLEALLRWNHPKRGRISPSTFIPIAERSGQIQCLGRWVLDAACRQMRIWQDAAMAPGLLGVNVSALHFKAVDLDRDVAASLGKWGIAPAVIEIELTESVLMEISQQHSDRFDRLQQLGVRIAIDDFGTGYSSLSYLANYPINRVKIAQELVSRVDADSRSAAVVRAAIRLAHELGLEIVAEGVETDGQERFLLSAGCEYGQGYYFSRPVDVTMAGELLRSGRIAIKRRPLRLAEDAAA